MDVTGSAAGSEVEMPSESELFALRLGKRKRLLELGDAYPATLARTHDAAAAAGELEQAEAGGHEETPEPLTVAGRVTGQRVMGKAAFLDLRDGSGRIQLHLRRDVLGEHFDLTRGRIRQIEARAMSKLRHPSSDTGARDLLAV